MKNLVTLALVLWSSALWAQHTLSGVVTDRATGEPLAGAHVVLSGPRTLGAVTDNEGRFAFHNLTATTWQLRVSYVGYLVHQDTLTVPGANHLHIALAADPYLQDEVVVLGTRAHEEAPFTFTEVKKEDLEDVNLGKDMPYLLQSLPSVVTYSDAGAGIGYTGMRIRGSDPTRINVTLNGIPYNDAESQGVFWVDLPDIASSVQSIQVQRGVGSSTNGAGAFGATVNMQTTGLNKEAYGYLDNAFGSFNTRKHTLAAGTGLLNNAFTIDARLSKIYSDGYIDRAFADLNSWFVSAGYTDAATMLRFNIFSGKEVTYQAWYGTPEARVRNDEAGMLAYIARNGLSPAEADNLLSSGRTYNYYTYDNQVDNYRQDHYQLLFSRQLGSLFTLNTALFYTHGEGYYEQYKADQNLSDYGFAGPIIGGVQIDTTDLIRRRWLNNDFYGFTFSALYNPGNWQFTLGGAWHTYDGDHYGEIIWAEIAGNARIRDRYYDNNGFKVDYNVYLKTTYHLNDKLAVYVDLQYRNIYYALKGLDSDRQWLQNKYNWPFFNPKAGINYRLNSATSLYASYSIANKEPSRSDLIDHTGLQEPVPETLHDIEIGYRKKSGNMRFNANFYYMLYKNQLVLTGELNDVGAPLRANVPDSYRTGIELDGAWQLTPVWGLAFNAAFSQNIINNFTEVIYDYGPNWDEYNAIEIEHGKTNIAFSPSLVAGASLRLTPVKGLEVSWEHRYVGDQYLDNTSNENRKLVAYYLSDLRAGYTFKALKLKEIKIKLAVYNLFNNLYEANGYTFGYRGGGSEVRENFYYPQAGINFMAGLSLAF